VIPIDLEQAVLLRDRSSGRVHAAVRRGGALLTDERCNLDDAGEHEEITVAQLAECDAGQLCKRCFGSDPDPEGAFA
jgi:hypothetical protein